MEQLLGVTPRRFPGQDAVCSQLGHDHHITGLGDQVGHSRMRGGVTAVWTRLIEADGFVKLTSVRTRYQYEAAVTGMHVAEIEARDDEIAVDASTFDKKALYSPLCNVF